MNLAEFGVVVKAPEGVEKTEQAFKRIDEAANKSTAAVNRHAGAFDNMARKTASANGLSATVAAQLQAAGVRYDAVSKTFTSASANIARSMGTTSTAAVNLNKAASVASGGIFAMGEAVRKSPQGIVALGNAMDKANAASKGAGASWLQFGKTLAGGIAVIAGSAAVLSLLAAGIYAARKAWEFFTDSLAAAGGVQSAQVSLKLMIGNAKEAQKIFQALNQIELKYGIFDEKVLLNAATRLYGIGIGVNDLVAKTRQLANVAAVLDQPIESAVSTYVRLYETLGVTGKLQARSLVQFAQQGFDVMLTLRTVLGKDKDEINRMVENGEIGIKQINAALADFAKNDFLGARAKTWEGIWKRLKAGWEEAQEAFGRPITDVLGPIFERLLDKEGDIVSMAERIGERFAKTIKDLDKAAADGRFADVLGDKIAAALLATIPVATRVFSTMVAEAAKTVFTFRVRLMVEAAETVRGWMARQMYGGAAGPDMEFKDGAWQPKGGAAYKPTGPDPLSMPSTFYGTTRDESDEPGGKDHFGGDVEKYKSDLKIINDYWHEYALIQATAATATEHTRRMIELETKTAQELADPAKYASQFTTIQGKWEAMEEARLRKTLEVDAKIRAGNATVFEAMESGIEKLLKSWGNMAQKMERAIQDIGNSLVNNISNGLTDIITGTVDLKTGFTNMAVSILKDIAAIIIKMQVEILLQTILNALRGVGGGGVTGTASVSAGIGMAVGGIIRGPSHAGGGVPIEAEGGEFMLKKSAVRNQQMDDLYALNEGRAEIVQRMDGGGFVQPRRVQRTTFGPYEGNQHAPRNSTSYKLWRDGYYDMEGIPHRAGNIALSRDLVQGARYGDIVTRGGYTGRFSDVTHKRLTNRVDFWEPTRGASGSGPRVAMGVISSRAATASAGYTPRHIYVGDYAVSPTLNTPGGNPFAPGGRFYSEFLPDGTPNPYAPGGVYSGENSIGTFGGDLSLGSDLNAGFTGPSYGTPIEDWVGRAGEASGGANLRSGADLRTFGSPSTYNTFRLGAHPYLSTPLATMRYGTGRYQLPVGHVYAAGTEDSTGTTYIDQGEGLSDRELAERNRRAVEGPRGGFNAGSLSPLAPPGMRVVGYDTVNGQPIYKDANGRLYVNPGTGTPIGSYYNYGTGQREALRETGSFRDNPNQGAEQMGRIRQTTTDAGHTQFNLRGGMRAVLDREGGFSMTSYNPRSGYDLRGWANTVTSAAGRAAVASPFSFTSNNTGTWGPQMHAGGIVGFEGMTTRMASGGEVPITAQRGEGVFTRGQMAAIGAGMSGGGNHVSIVIQVDSHDNVSSSTSRTEGRDAEEWKNVGRLCESIVNQKLRREKDYGGQLYRSQTGAPR